MSNFNIKRFTRVAQWTWRMNFKGVLSFAAGLSFAYLFPMFGWLYPALKGAKETDAGRLVHTVELCTMVYMIVIIIAGTWIFADMKTKEERIKVKMLPATDLEKYLARWLGVTVGTMFVGILAYCVADMLRMVTCMTLGFDSFGCTITDFLKMFFLNNDGDAILRESSVYAAGTDYVLLYDSDGTGISECPVYAAGTIYALVGWVIWAQSLYVLGGTLLRRYQFVITTLVHILLFLALAAVVAWMTTDADRMFAYTGNDAALYAAGAVFMAIAVLNWWFSYRIFKRMQVINNKWINL